MRMEICQFILPLSCLLLLTTTSSIYSQCPVPPLSTDVRLVDGDSHCAGIVEILYYGEWHTVCNCGWSMVDATAVCRRMLCGDAVATPGRAHFGAGTRWISKQMCCVEWGLAPYCCGHDGWGGDVYPPCGHQEDAGVICSEALGINYPVSPVCAVTGSTVVIPCEYDYPQSLRVVKFMWCHNDVHCQRSTHVCRSDNTNINVDYWRRAECFGDRVKNCALKIKNVKDTDAGVYQVGFTSSYVTGIRVSGPGVTLQVRELKVVITSPDGSRTLREGDSVNLRCDTESCSLSQSGFTWFKDDQLMTETWSTLHFSPVCKYHSGKYSCALKDSKVSNKMDLIVQGGAWTVDYPEKTLCAVRGSTVVIECEYHYPKSYSVESMMWSHNTEDCTGTSYVCHSNNINIKAEYRGRAECLGDNVKSCMLKINDITDTDAGVYRFRFTTNGCEECGQLGVALRVGELKVVITSPDGSRTLREGDSVNLRCDTESCSLSQSGFTWFKDDQLMTETWSTLHFSPVCKYHSGKYSCALKDSKVSNKMDLIVQGGAWTVDYPEKTLCAVRGSTVVIECEYHYPKSYSVESMMWSHNTEDCTGTSYVCHSNNINIKAEYRGRAECLGDNVKSCMLKINDITDTDAGVYRFRFTTNGCEECGQPGVALRVGELKVVITSPDGSRTLREGDSVNLICDTESCSLSQSEFTWFKDDQPMTETRSTLHFNPVSYHHAGKYSCALKGYRGTLSNPILLLLQSNGNPLTVILVVLGVLLSVLPIICISRRKIKLMCNRGGNRGGIKQSCHSDSDNCTYAALDVSKKSPEYNTMKSAANDRDPALQESHPIYQNMTK